MTDQLLRHLNSLFSARKPRPTPSVHVVNGVRITKKGKLWGCQIGKEQFFSTHLGDLKITVRRETEEAK